MKSYQRIIIKNLLICLTVFLTMVFSLVGCSFSKKSEGIETGNSSYGWCSFGNVPFDGGVLAMTGRVWVFDGEAKQMVPLCTRPECEHNYNWSASADESDCPASYLGRRATTLAVYEGQIWYVYENENKWEFWTAEQNGEDHALRQKAELGGEAPNAAESLFYDDCYYTVTTTIVEDSETGEIEIKNRLVQVNLADGQVEGLTEAMDVSANPELLGIYGDWIYYTAVITDEEGKLTRNMYRLSRKSRGAEDLGQGNWCALDGHWLTYVHKEGNGQGGIYLRDLENGETKRIYEVEIEKFASLYLSGGELLWTDYREETQDYTCRIYHIEEEKLLETAPYQKPYQTWLNVEDGWLISAQSENIGPSTSPDDYVEYFYIEEKDLLAGKEPERVK